MLIVPSRDRLGAIAEAVNRIVPVSSIGLCSRTDDGRVSVFYSHDNGIGEYVVAHAETPDALLPGSDEPVQAALPENPEPSRPIEWVLHSIGGRHIAAVPVPGEGPALRFWVSSTGSAPLDAGQFARLAHAATGVRSVLVTAGSSELEQLRRLERTSLLLPALLRALDVREVFDRVSEIARQALPHDLMLLRLLDDDLSSITIFARSDSGADLGPVVPTRYPPAVWRAWSFGIVDDLTVHPIEQDQAAVKLGARASLRVPIRIDGRVVAGVGFVTFEPARFGSDDVPVAKRLADHIAVGLSHYRLAEESRRTTALKERTANLEMLDGLLATLTGVLDIREVFERVSAIAQKVLPHDGLSIAEVIDRNDMVRIHASHGLGDIPQPLDIPLADPTLLTDRWDYRLIDEVGDHPEYASGPGARAGMRSMLFVNIRLEGRNFGGLNFYSRAPRRFTKDDVLVARRIADHVALALSHRRLAEQARQHEELRARTARNDLLDALLGTLSDSGDVREVFERVTAIAGKVLPHDAAALMIRLPEGAHARMHASSGFPAGMPAVSEIPEELIANPEWEHDVFADLSLLPAPHYRSLAELGFKSLLRVAIRLEGRWAGALVLVSKEAGRYSHTDLPAAHRIADKLSLAQAHDREVAASRRADEATERAAKLERRVRDLTEELDARTGYRRVAGESKEWRQVLTHATQVAATETTVLLLGESGTGKEVVARFLHRASARKGGPFIALNCAALPEQLLEAELFGYERGAYTGATHSKPGQLEQASGGTLFLDEVGEMSPSAQAKFLRVLQEREFQRLGGTRVLRTDARIVAATNRDLPRAIAAGQFREDLYYRLNVFAIRLPALRDRRDDILPLSEAFLTEIGRGLGRPPGGISREARQTLIDYHWPGNVRELRNILERAAILCDGGLITPEHLALTTSAPAAASITQTVSLPARSEDPAPTASSGAPISPPAAAGNLHDVERAMIEQALQNARFNKSKAAKALGLTRHQLYIRMRRHGIAE